jgi:hypothetical protein
MFCLPVAGGVAKHTVFDGAGWIWPWLLASCAVAAIWNWRVAALVAIGVSGAQGIEQLWPHPLAAYLQFAVWAIVAFTILGLADKVAAGLAAVVSLLYLGATVGALAWFPAIVLTEFAIVFALWAGAVNGAGPTRKDMGKLGSDTARLAPVYANSYHHRRGDYPNDDRPAAQESVCVSGDDPSREG